MPPNGAIQAKIIKTDDESFFARVWLNNVEPQLIEYNEKVIDKYFKEKNIVEDNEKLLFLVQISVHELVHTKTFGLIKGKEQQELVSELSEQLFKNIINNIHLFPV